MSAISIIVYKEMDGFTFSILPSVREFIKKLFPGSQPASRMHIGFETASNFDLLESGIEKQIYPTLLGVEKEELKKQITDIEFVNYQTGKVEKIHP